MKNQGRKVLKAVMLIACMGGFAPGSFAIPITVDGTEWLQPIDFVNRSWNEISTVCDPTSGLCSGSLGGNDLTGWTWANVDDVNALFNHYIPGAPMGPGPDDLDRPYGTFSTPFFADGWTVTEVQVSGATWVVGLARELWFGGAYTPRIGGDEDRGSDLAITEIRTDPSTAAATSGAWFYRAVATPPTETPLAPTMYLVGLGLAALRYSRRKRKLHTKSIH